MVHILIPAHNDKQEVLSLLSCLSRQSYKAFRIILIDDGSTDGTKEEVSRLFPHAVILVGDGNLWWTRANCLGVDYILPEAGDRDYIILLNNDLVVESGYLARLVEAGNKFPGALVGSTVVDYHNHAFMESGVRIGNHFEITVNRDREKINRTEVDLEVDVLPGRGTLIPVEVFRKIGNFNPKKLPHYGADYEFSIRARRAGYKLLVSHKAIVFARLDITGLEAPETITTLTECCRLLFSNKSKSNIRYWLNFCWLCSEKEFRLRNTVFIPAAILRDILLKTEPLAPAVKLVRRVPVICGNLFARPVFFILRFLFTGYPLGASEIERQGLGLKDLLDANLIVEFEYRGKKLYLLHPELQKQIINLSNPEKQKLSELVRLSRSFSYKASVIQEKLKTLVSRRQPA